MNVTLNGQTVGRVELKQEGLYCRISCRCRVDDGEIHRLYAAKEKIGVLVPERGELVLETKVAAKRLKPGCDFSLDAEKGKFVPIHPGEQFAHLDRLRGAKLTIRDGCYGVIIR